MVAMLLDIKDLKLNFPRACTEEGKRFHFSWKADVISGDISHIYLYHQLLETYIFLLSLPPFLEVVLDAGQQYKLNLQNCD